MAHSKAFRHSLCAPIEVFGALAKAIQELALESWHPFSCKGEVFSSGSVDQQLALQTKHAQAKDVKQNAHKRNRDFVMRYHISNMQGWSRAAPEQAGQELIH